MNDKMLVRVCNHLALEQDFTGYYDNDDSSYSDGSEHHDHDRDDFYSFYDSNGIYANE